MTLREKLRWFWATGMFPSSLFDDWNECGIGETGRARLWSFDSIGRRRTIARQRPSGNRTGDARGGDRGT